MKEEKFKEAVFKLAKRVKKEDLSIDEKNEIIIAFNENKSDSDYKRAIKAIEKITGKKNIEMIIEKSASLDDITRLIKDVSDAADEWSKSK